MFKGLIQIALMGALLVATAFAEAVAPIWIADSVSSSFHLISEKDEGSMRGWRDCLNRSWPPSGRMTNTSHRDACVNLVSSDVTGALKIINLRLDDGRLCGKTSDIRKRHFSATIRNDSQDTYVADALWYGMYPTKPLDTNAYGHLEDLWLAPGTSMETCLFTLQFETKADAQLYDQYPEQLYASIVNQRGMTEK